MQSGNAPEINPYPTPPNPCPLPYPDEHGKIRPYTGNQTRKKERKKSLFDPCVLLQQPQVHQPPPTPGTLQQPPQVHLVANLQHDSTF